MKVELRELTKKFPSRNKNGTDVVAVSSMNLTIPSGELVGLLGPSGCGKSTTLNLISGLEKPTEGSIFFGEEEVTALPPEKRGIGLVFQNYALYPHLTVYKNIIFPLENLKGKDKLTKEQMRERAYEAARLVNIEELMDRRPAELSGGQCNHINHVSTQLPYSFTVAAISFVMFIISGYVQSVWICLPLGIALTVLTLFIIKKVAK